MRSTTHLWDSLAEVLEQYLPSDGIAPGELCDAELGLSCLATLLPGAPASTLCHLLRGYDFAQPVLLGLSQPQQEMLATTRTILLAYKSERGWRDLLEQYRQVEDRFRLFDVDTSLTTFTRRAVTVCSERENVYQAILSAPLPYQTRALHWGEAGKTYLCFDHSSRTHVTIPEDLPLPSPPARHSLHFRQTHPPIRPAWSELLETAQWMDTQEQSLGISHEWEQRLRRVRLEVSPNTQSGFTQASHLHFEGMQNYVGIVSVGKSTVMDVTAVWAARNGYRITLVVGDVMALFERVQLFARLGLRVAPITGTTNRELHINRLYRALAARQEDHPLLHEHRAFRYTSSTCLLDGLRHTATPFLLDPQPCLTLHLPSRRKKSLGEPEKKSYACPLFAACPYHEAQKDLVDASIWIATPASLIYTRVAPQINTENLTFLELVCMVSDIVIVDEADRVQMQLDQMFSPSQVLMSKKKDAWLGYLLAHVNEQLSSGGCRQVREEPVRKWASILNVASTALQSMYNLLQSHQSLYSWIKGEQDYFNELTLLEKMAVELSGVPASQGNSPFQHAEVKRIVDAFNDFLNDPLAEESRHDLGYIALEAIASTKAPVRAHLCKWLKTLAPRISEEEELLAYTIRLQFVLMLGVLSHCLEALINDWKQVEAALGLEGNNSMLFHRPPKDYAALLPDTPMGNILGYQYLPSSENQKDAGELRFFRCTGVGRALLLNLHTLFDAHGFVGPHVLLLSGTSWAGTSPSYHIQVPVTGVLRAPDDDIEQIAQSTFEFKHLHSPYKKDPLWLSGKRAGQESVTALHEMLDALSRKDRFTTSLLEQECANLPEGRKRILLLVGSYQEARQAYEYLAKQREDWEDQMMYLVPDDETFESEWQSARLQRGIVDRFSSTSAWLLIAPLLAVERGHNILNDERKAALGAVYFLKRPHPRPNDIAYHIHCINRWAIQHGNNGGWLSSTCQMASPPLELASKQFRAEAYKEWRRLLRVPLIYKTMGETDQDALTWSQLVSIWQVIGRLVRGGCPARVVFCDANFGSVTVDAEGKKHLYSGLLFGMREVLAPYFEATLSPTMNAREKALVRILYEPLYQALESLSIQL